MVSNIKSLTWKYFWEQKKSELSDWWYYDKETVIIFSILLSMLFQLGWVVVLNGVPSSFAEGGHRLCEPLAIIGLCIIGFWILVGILVWIKCFIDWVISNWNKAKKKAEMELERIDKLNKLASRRKRY
jgi:hypothetical protein